MRFRLNSKTIVISFAVLLLIYFVILPMGVLLIDSVWKDGTINLGNYREVYRVYKNFCGYSEIITKKGVPHETRTGSV